MGDKHVLTLMHIRKRLQTGEYETGLTKSQRSNMSRQLKNYKVERNTFFKLRKDRFLEIIFTDEKKEEAFLSGHRDHLGITKTTQNINEEYFWPNSTKEVRKMVMECAGCNAKKDTRGKQVKQECGVVDEGNTDLNPTGEQTELNPQEEFDNFLLRTTTID